MSISKSQLARDLRISRTTLYKCIDKGMPVDSVSAAKEWRDRYLNFTMTKESRIGGNNGGVKRNQLNNDIKWRVTNYVLAELIPKMWFEQPGWLGSILKDNGVKITAEQLLKTQQCLFLVYTEVINEYFGEDVLFSVGSVIRAIPDDEIYPSLMARLNEIVEE